MQIDSLSLSNLEHEAARTLAHVKPVADYLEPASDQLEAAYAIEEKVNTVKEISEVVINTHVIRC
jgi:hypothetical protein